MNRKTRYEGLSRALANTRISSQEVERRLLRRGLRPRWQGEPPSRFRELATDSRVIERDDLFCAILGTESDGHDYVSSAARAGATAAVVERLLPDELIPQLVVSDTHQAAAQLASLFAGDPGSSLSLIGITGTNGKTTSAWLCRHVLSDLRRSAALGTLGVVDATGEVVAGGLTTPGPVDLMTTLARLRDEGTQHVAMEVSSHALDQRRVDGLRFDAVVFTNFSREHLEYHADLEDYLEAKLRLVELLEPGGLCVVNADEEAWREIAAPGGRLVTYGVSDSARVRAEDIRILPDRSQWSLVTPEGTARVDLPLAGAFNVSNALAVSAVALGLGMVPSRIAELLASAPPVNGRMEVLTREPTLVMRDYAHTPDAYEQVLGSLRESAPGRLYVVFGCGGDRDPGKRPLMGAIATRYADLSLITTDNPRSEDPADIAAQVVAGLDSRRYEIVLDRREAIARALELAGAGDVVVLLGKGHEGYQLIGERRLPFDEKTVVRELLGTDDDSIDEDSTSDDSAIDNPVVQDRTARTTAGEPRS